MVARQISEEILETKEKIRTHYNLPEGWCWVKLGDHNVFKIIMGQSPPGSTYTDKPEGLPFFQGKADFRDYFPKVRIWCTQPIKIAQEGDILISVRAPVGPVNMSNSKCCIGRGLAIIRCLDSANSWFIFWYFRSIEAEIASLGSGSTFGAITRDDLINLQIPLPPIEEQKRIATKIQELMQEISNLQSAIFNQSEAVNALPSAYLREIFESEEAKNWERKRLDEVCEWESGIWGDEPDGSSECYFVLRSNNIKDGKMVFDEIAIRKIETKYLGIKSLKYGDILVTTSSGSKDLLGKSAIFISPDDKVYLFSNFTMRLRAKPEIADSSYLYFYLQSPDAKKVLQLIQDTTTGLRNLDRKEFQSQLIPSPSLEIQYCIASYLKEKMSQVEKLQSTISNLQSTIEALPQTILRKHLEEN